MYLFEIFSKPVPQKQTQWCKTWAYDPSRKDRDSLIWQMKPYAPNEPFFGPTEVDLMFYLPMPKSSKIQQRMMLDGRILPIKRPDLDNLGYLVTNAMTQLFYNDDSQIVDLHLHKRYAEIPRTVVKIIPGSQTC
jgi:Holliday junction resolvase RusA-like endonuclease